MPEQGRRSRPRLLGRLPLLRRQPRAFEAELARQTAERHARLLEPDGFLPHPAGWRASDLIDGTDGFLPLGEAARVQGCTEAELLALIRRGLIEVNERGHARPAIVSVLAVRG